MYVIITYDVNERRVGKVCKKLKQYLTWSQNSVFEGTITKGSLSKCLHELELIVHDDEDSIYLYRVENPKHIKKVIYGVRKDVDDMFM